MLPPDTQVQSQFIGHRPVVLGKQGAAAIARFHLQVQGGARRGVGVAQQEVGEGVAGVTAVEGEAAARRGRILEVEGGNTLELAAEFHGVLAADPAQIVVDFVIALAVAGA